MSSTDPQPEPARWRRLLLAARVDTSPLRRYRDFRLLFVAGLVSLFGDFVTMVAAPLQMKQLTGSFVAVGLIGMFELAPLLAFGLWGGAIADAYDRRKVMLVATVVEATATAALLANAGLGHHAHPWVVYAAAAISASGMSLRRPSLDSLQARLVDRADQPAANALSGVQSDAGAIIAPALGGVIAASSMMTAYALDLATFVVALVLIARIRPVPPEGGGEPVSLRGIAEGIRYAARRRDLLGTYVADIVAMTFAMSEAMYPFLADTLHRPGALGLLYSAGAVGGILASVTSGWTARVHRHGLAILLAGLGWGGGMALAGVAPDLAAVLACIALAGAADAVSGIFRSTVWNQTIPDRLRGRLAGIEMLSWSIGPTTGNARSGLMARWGGVRFALWGGGLACIGGLLITAIALPAFVGYDARTGATHADDVA